MSSITDPTPLHSSQTTGHTDHDKDHGHDAPHHEDGKVHGDHSPYGLGHISSWQTLVKVWVALMVLTILTVMATWVNLGTLNIWIAMTIACIKATLVVIYFMHMKHNKPFLVYIFTFSLAFVAFFLAMVVLDSNTYQPDIEKRRLDDIEQTPIKQILPVTPTTPTSPAPPTKAAH